MCHAAAAGIIVKIANDLVFWTDWIQYPDLKLLAYFSHSG